MTIKGRGPLWICLGPRTTGIRPWFQYLQPTNLGINLISYPGRSFYSEKIYTHLAFLVASARLYKFLCRCVSLFLIAFGKERSRRVVRVRLCSVPCSRSVIDSATIK